MMVPKLPLCIELRFQERSNAGARSRTADTTPLPARTVISAAWGVPGLNTQHRNNARDCGLYPTKDGRVVAAAPLEQKFWETFCDIIGLER
jgi:hypothetical protein